MRLKHVGELIGQLRQEADGLREVLSEFVDYRNGACEDSCASQPTWLSGALEQGDCDCMVGRAKSLLLQPRYSAELNASYEFVSVGYTEDF